MKRTIYLKVEIDWEGYDDVHDEIIIDDSGIYAYIKDGVEVSIIDDIPQPPDKCDQCGCHPTELIRSEKGTHCKSCWEALQRLDHFSH